MSTGPVLTLIKEMEAALGRSDQDMTPYFHEDFVWDGNTGCGIKRGIAEFRANWQLPLRAAFTERDYLTEKWMEDGNWAACYGAIEGTHSGAFMGIAATGKRIRVPYIDFWEITDGRISYNKVSVDFPQVLAQLGVDVFNGEGWESYDRGEKTPPKPE